MQDMQELQEERTDEQEQGPYIPVEQLTDANLFDEAIVDTVDAWGHLNTYIAVLMNLSTLYFSICECWDDERKQEVKDLYAVSYEQVARIVNHVLDGLIEVLRMQERTEELLTALEARHY